MAEPHGGRILEKGYLERFNFDVCLFGLEYISRCEVWEMTVFSVGGLNELDKLPCRRTRDYRTGDSCPRGEVVHDLKNPAKREQRIQEKVKENVGT